MSMSDFLEQSALNYTFRGVAWTPAGTLYAAAYTADPTDAGNGTTFEVTAGGYARVALIRGTAAWNAPTVGGTIDNIAALNFGTATADWGTVTYLGLVDTSTGTGNMYMAGSLTAQKVIGSGDVFQVVAGALDVTFA